MIPPIVTAVGHDRLDDLLRQARRDALARAARRASRRRHGHRAPSVLAAAARRAARPGPARTAPDGGRQVPACQGSAGSKPR